MSSKTSNLKMTKWLENDPVDFEEVNNNFQSLDDCTLCFERGIKSANYTGGSNGMANWIYRKYTGWDKPKPSDNMNIIKTVETNTIISLNDWKIESGSDAPYYSSDLVVNLPFTIGTISNVNMNLAIDHPVWVCDITNYGEHAIMINQLTIKLYSTTKLSVSKNKWLMINVKGVLS